MTRSAGISSPSAVRTPTTLGDPPTWNLPGISPVTLTPRRNVTPGWSAAYWATAASITGRLPVTNLKTSSPGPSRPVGDRRAACPRADRSTRIRRRPAAGEPGQLTVGDTTESGEQVVGLMKLRDAACAPSDPRHAEWRSGGGAWIRLEDGDPVPVAPQHRSDARTDHAATAYDDRTHVLPTPRPRARHLGYDERPSHLLRHDTRAGPMLRGEVRAWQGGVVSPIESVVHGQPVPGVRTVASTESRRARHESSARSRSPTPRPSWPLPRRPPAAQAGMGKRARTGPRPRDRPHRSADRGQRRGLGSVGHAGDRQAVRRGAGRGSRDRRHVRLLPRRRAPAVRADGAE